MLLQRGKWRGCVDGQSWISRGARWRKDARGQTRDEQLFQKIMTEEFARLHLRAEDTDSNLIFWPGMEWSTCHVAQKGLK